MQELRVAWEAYRTYERYRDIGVTEEEGMGKGHRGGNKYIRKVTHRAHRTCRETESVMHRLLWVACRAHGICSS